jgi:hypothetical protein
MSNETKTKSTFTDIATVDLEKDKQLKIKQIENEEWSDDTKTKGVFYIEESMRDKKGLVLTKSDLSKVSEIFKEIAEK